MQYLEEAKKIWQTFWRARHPKLCDWFDRLAARASFVATAPPSVNVR